jgi:Rrf2 family protein
LVVLSQTVEYALRVVVQLAAQAPNLQTTEQLAAVTKISKPYLSKVIQALGRARIVHSRKGVGGGVQLLHDPKHLSILEVVNAVEPLQRIRTCPLGLRSHGIVLCPLHTRLDCALAEMEQAFRDTTVAEVLAEPTQSTPLCEEAPTSAKRKPLN